MPAALSRTWFRNVPEEDFVSLMKNFPGDSQWISAWARETTLDLKASLLEPDWLLGLWEGRALGRSVKRPMRRGWSEGLRSREMGSKRRERPESRCGTRRMR